ncbi:hypothetical protein R1sor_026003 [Riccia sorocarpa]|uniref:Uncharacterized protein n=1 Tax=Riccia sorocarpa TaxID=122646 RepID=A0ABD3GD85_9MARC
MTYPRGFDPVLTEYYTFGVTKPLHGTGGQKRTTKYNIASFIASSISRETMWVKNHLKVTHPQRYCEMFVGIPLMLIFLHCGVITEEECETAFEIPETGWDFPADGPEVNADEERDIPGAANSLNHPYNAVHLPQFVQHLPRVGQDEFVMDRLLPWLRRWAHDTSPTTSWVELYRREVDGADPLAGLRRYWGQASDIDRRIIWKNVPRSEAMVLAGFWRAMLVQTRDTDCPGDDCPPAPEAEDPTLEPEEPTRELDEPTREPAVLAEESARVPLGVPCSRRLPLFE